MKVMVVGLGSMGKRRIRLLKKYDLSIIILGVESNKERRIVCEEEYGILTFSSIEELLEKNTIKCGFICTSPASHHILIKDCLLHNIHVFTELNLVSDGYLENTNIAREKDLVLFLSSTFLYRDDIMKIKEKVNGEVGHLNYTYHVGQYLPDWHPWENYMDYFVGQKRTNGCRELFAIELPWLVDTFGEIESFEVIKDRMTKLKIEYNDNYLLMVRHKTGHKGIIALDVVTRKAVRRLEVIGEFLYLKWNGSPASLIQYDYELEEERSIATYETIEQLSMYNNSIVENAYYNEIETFFEVLKGNQRAKYDFEKDQMILRLIDEIEA